MSTGAWLAILAGLGFVGFVAYRVYGGSGLSCPDPTSEAFRQILSKIASGETKPEVAETMAKGYDNAGCPVAASAIRAIAPAGKLGAAPLSPLSPVLSPGKKSDLSPGSALSDYVLTTGDLASGPVDFARRAGFSSPEALAASNPGTRVVDNPGGLLAPGVFDEPSPLDPKIVYHKRFVPFRVGRIYKVARDPMLPLTAGAAARHAPREVEIDYGEAA